MSNFLTCSSYCFCFFSLQWRFHSWNITFRIEKEIKFFSLFSYNKDFFLSLYFSFSILKQKCLLEICHFIQVILSAFLLLFLFSFLFLLCHSLKCTKERKTFFFFSSIQHEKEWLIIFNYCWWEYLEEFQRCYNFQKTIKSWLIKGESREWVEETEITLKEH